VYTASSKAMDAPDYFAPRSPGVPIPYYPEMKIYVPRILRYLREARADRINVVHLTTPGPVGLAAMFVASRLGLPMVGSFHTDLAAYATLLSGSGRLGGLMREYMRWPYGRCERVLVPSHHTREQLIEAKANPEKIALWRRGVDTALFDPAKRSADVRRRWGVSDRRPALLFVGRVSREKGLTLLPSLERRLRAQGLQHRFVIAGQGPMEAELRGRMPDAVFTGVLGREEVAAAFASADLFVFPSRTETAGNVLLEAQACALPVVASAGGAGKENLVDGRTGIVCLDDSVEEWTRVVGGFVRDRACRAAFSEEARDFALTRSWERALEPLYQTYRDACVHGEPTSDDAVAIPAQRA
jgi:glycosyltransferase involved in cell wall biosynthesis